MLNEKYKSIQFQITCNQLVLVIAALIGDIYYLLPGLPGVWIDQMEADSPKKKLKKFVKFAEILVDVHQDKNYLAFGECEQMWTSEAVQILGKKLHKKVRSKSDKTSKTTFQQRPAA